MVVFLHGQRGGKTEFKTLFLEQRRRNHMKLVTEHTWACYLTVHAIVKKKEIRTNTQNLVITFLGHSDTTFTCIDLLLVLPSNKDIY